MITMITYLNIDTRGDHSNISNVNTYHCHPFRLVIIPDVIMVTAGGGPLGAAMLNHPPHPRPD